LLLTGHALDYESFFFRVNQVLTRRNTLQPIYSHARFFNFRYGSNPKQACVIETKAITILDFLKGLRGSLHVTLEEGSLVV
jgi:hypothetical protein